MKYCSEAHKTCMEAPIVHVEPAVVIPMHWLKRYFKAFLASTKASRFFNSRQPTK